MSHSMDLSSDSQPGDSKSSSTFPSSSSPSGGGRPSLHVNIPHPLPTSSPPSTSNPFTVPLPLPPRTPFPTSRFKKVRTIRKTLMGKVVLFQDVLTNKLVAIKVSDKQLLISGRTSGGNAVAENPLEEVKTMNILAGTVRKPGINPNIVGADGQQYVLTSLGEYEDDKYLYTVMPFCAKGEFFDIVCNETRFSESKARKYFIQMMLGLRYLHAFGMCHLDLSLENLLMTEDDTLKICDYGVARHLMYDPHSGKEIPYPPALSNKPGKLSYMAPEVFNGQPFSGYLADVYSCGVILFISLLGVPPYQIPAASDQRFALIFSGNIYKLLQAWNMTNLLTPLAIDLLTRMLAPEKHRISVNEIFNHPWVLGPNEPHRIAEDGKAMSDQHQNGANGNGNGNGHISSFESSAFSSSSSSSSSGQLGFSSSHFERKNNEDSDVNMSN